MCLKEIAKFNVYLENKLCTLTENILLYKVIHFHNYSALRTQVNIFKFFILSNLNC